MSKETRWYISDKCAERGKLFNMTKQDLSDMTDATGIGDNTILKILEKATEMGFIVPKGTELRQVERFIRTQLPNNVLDVLEEIDNMK
jgi:hypothetical protein